MKTLLASTAIATLLAVPGVAQTQTGTAAGGDMSKTMAVYDLNGDGVIDQADLKMADTNGDGVVDSKDTPQMASGSGMAPTGTDTKAADGTMAAGTGTGTMATGTDTTKTGTDTMAAGTGTAMPTTDTNGDGVIDSKDAMGTDTMAAGTGTAMPTTDTNGDGVIDSKDAMGTDTMAAGTGTAMPTTDTNGDGVIDSKDAMGTDTMAAGTGTAMPTTDTNGDGVIDSKDAVASNNGAAAPAGTDNQPKVSDLGNDITGQRVYDSNGDWIGEVSEMVLSDDKSKTFAIIDVGGFLGIGEKPVALDVSELNIAKTDDNGGMKVSVNKTKDELNAMQTYKKS